MSRARFAIWLEYDGTDFVGWQSQANGVSIQQTVETALSTALRMEIRVAAAGRTDAGVHALGQVAAFSHPDPDLDTFRLHRALTGILPRSIGPREIRRVADDFDPRRDAIRKTYRYRFMQREAPAPLAERYAWVFHAPRVNGFDIARLRGALPHLLGTHDFSAFMSAGASTSTTERTIEAIELRPWGDPRPELLRDAFDGGWELDFTGDGFLRGQVRAMTGTLIDIASGKLAPDDMPEIIASRDRTRAGTHAPARGLCLLHVEYPPVQIRAATVRPT